MKKAFLIAITVLLGVSSFAQETDSTGLEGDNLDLNGVLELFKQSKDVEDFEKQLNTESNGVNNLDLNEDGEVDYIRVVDHADSNAHTLALQVPVTETESQDVAVIEMEEVEEDKVNLQVIGDSDLYGEEYMIEPADEKNPKVVVNVNTWRPVRHIYSPRYVAWNSPYRWGNYPRWHRPWRRVSWAVYRPRAIRYHRPYYRRTTVRRCNRAHRYYGVRRVHSPYFHNNHKSIGVKKTTTVKKTNNGTVVKKQTTTVKKNPSSTKGRKQTTVNKSPAPKTTQKRVSTQKKVTQSKSSTRKRPGGTKRKTNSSRSKTTSTRKGKR